MRLNDLEQRMRAGELGEPRRFAIEQQIAVGEFFDAEDFVAVSQVHLCADTEALGPSGVAFLERLAGAPEAERRVMAPTITDPRGADLARYERIRQPDWVIDLERRAASRRERTGGTRRRTRRGQNNRGDATGQRGSTCCNLCPARPPRL
jgi:predicted aconitase